MTRKYRMNEEDLDRLVHNAAILQNANKNATWVGCLMQVQSDLFPKEKHYSKGTFYNISEDLKKRASMGKIVVNPLFFGEKPKETVEATVKTTVDKLPPIGSGFQITQNHKGPDVAPPIMPAYTKPKKIPGILDRFTFSDKISEMASCLAKQFEDQLTGELEAALSTALGNVERSFAKKLEDARKITGQKRQQLPRVMVIGVMGEVAFQTESEYGEMLDLRFYKQEENLSLIRSQAKHCDYVVLIVGHINHGHQDCVREHPGLIFCNGGVTQMKEILLTLACK